MLNKKIWKARNIGVIFMVLFMCILIINFVPAKNLTWDLSKHNITFVYDEKNRIISNQDINYYYYDENMNNTLTNISNTNSVVKYEYDNKGRVIKEIKLIDGLTFEKIYNYDSMDRIVSLNGINYIYGEDNNLIGINSIINEIYNQNSQIINREYNNGLNTDFIYGDNNFRLNHIKTGNIQELNYSYDNVSNLKEINDMVKMKNYFMNYDSLNRLIFSNITDLNAVNYIYSYFGGLLELNSDRLNISYLYNNFSHVPTLVLYGSTLPNDTNKFYVQNDNGEDVAWIGDFGNIVLKGKCSLNPNCDNPSDGSFIFENLNGNITAYIDSFGNLCIEEGNCVGYENNCNPTEDSFLIQNIHGENMSYISFNGKLCLRGGVYDDVEFF